jgi:hypothetical protein
MSGKQRQFQRPAVVRLPQISPLQVSVRRRPLIISPDKQLPLTEHMPTTRRALPSYPRSEQRLPLTEHIPTLPVTPMPQAPIRIYQESPVTQVMITPPISAYTQMPLRASYPYSYSFSGYPIEQLTPVKGRDREPGTGELLLGCGVLFLVGLMVIAVLYYLSFAM